MNENRRWAAALALIVLLGLCLRLYHIRDPVLDHPGWRQGDQAAIARNFAQLENNIFRPQVDYDGPPPNYIELELQIVPFAAAQLYRAFGVHEIFGRALVLCFSVATIFALLFLGQELFCRRAGLIAAFFYAVAPGAVYYGRTFTPDSVMVFFSVVTLLFWWRWNARRDPAAFWLAVVCGALAWLAKPTALILLAPLLAMSFSRRGVRAFADWSMYGFLLLTLAPLIGYLWYEHRIAQWHWASGITTKHVLPQLVLEVTQAKAFGAALAGSLALLRTLASTILGPVLFALTLVGFVTQPGGETARHRSWMLGAWLAALALYTFVVVNVERVDYYMLPWLPFAAIVAAGAVENVWAAISQGTRVAGPTTLAALGVVAFFITYVDMLEIHPYYTWSRPVYSAATELDRTLEPGALIVMGHYDPSVLYLINRKGWEEDVLLWNVHDMTSAIAKGARYLVAVEVPRFRANKPLYRFMQRYRRVPVASGWEVYDMHHFALGPRTRSAHK